MLKLTRKLVLFGTLALATSGVLVGCGDDDDTAIDASVKVYDAPVGSDARTPDASAGGADARAADAASGG